jgi:hypothetical protein
MEIEHQEGPNPAAGPAEVGNVVSPAAVLDLNPTAFVDDLSNMVWKF